ncbi:MAG: hypothetical protein N2578_03180, partial [Bdellovibrionaceae bacterium]|nr:hypothetical protein [Pseudobdellovibrionaceae bacterium]
MHKAKPNGKSQGAAPKRRRERIATRKKVEPLRVSHVSSAENLARIFRDCEIIEASSTGLLLHISRASI